MDGTARRPLPWVASVLYGAVLVAGLYVEIAGLCPHGRDLPRTAGFAAVLLFLLALEQLERGSRNTGIALLVLRMVLFEVAGALDCSGFSRALYLLIPFTAYFLLGRYAAYAFATFYLAAVVIRLSLAVPGWYTVQEHVSDLLMFGIGLVFAVSMAAVAVEQRASRARAEALLADLKTAHQKLRSYADRVGDLAAATERNRLARDIHDSLGHHLTAIAVQLEKAAAFRQRDPAAADQAVADAKRSATHALEDVRQSVGTLRHPDGTFPLATALAALVEGADGAVPAVELDVAGDETGYGSAGLMALYRVAQEGLTNARRHAGASRVTVQVRLGEGGASLVVADDGQGFSTARTPEGYGLRGMRERLELVGGVLRLESAPGRGTRLDVDLPREAP